MVKAHILNSKLVKSNFRFTKRKHIHMSYVVCRMFIFMNFLLHISGTFHLYLPSFFTSVKCERMRTYKIMYQPTQWKSFFNVIWFWMCVFFIGRWDCNEEDMVKRLDRIKDESIGDAISMQSAVFRKKRTNVRTKKCLKNFATNDINTTQFCSIHLLLDVHSSTIAPLYYISQKWNAWKTWNT